jgi:hypothetical protein
MGGFFPISPEKKRWRYILDLIKRAMRNAQLTGGALPSKISRQVNLPLAALLLHLLWGAYPGWSSPAVHS